MRQVPGKMAAGRWVLTLVAGLAIGWSLAGGRPRALRAEGGDRSGESILATGPVAMEYDRTKQSVMAKDAVFFLDYAGARLLATVPAIQQSPGSIHVLSDFAERDLIADFGLPRNVVPHFAMTSGGLGAFGEGWSPIYVVEQVTKQIAVYRVVEQRSAASTQPRFELLERKPLGRSDLPPAR